MFPVAGVPIGDAAAEEVAEDPARSGVSGPNSASRRSAQYGDADPEWAAPRGEGEGARSKSARLDPARLGMNLSL
jgi:hypothetical protein